MLANYRGFGAFGAALVLLAHAPEEQSRCRHGEPLRSGVASAGQAFNSSCLDGSRNPRGGISLALIDPCQRIERRASNILQSPSRCVDARRFTDRCAKLTNFRTGGSGDGRLGPLVAVSIGRHLLRCVHAPGAEALLEMDVCPSATPWRTLMWFVSSRDVDAALNVKWRSPRSRRNL